MKVLNEWGGCKNPGLKSIANAEYNHHNAIVDAVMLMNLFTRQSPYKDLMVDNYCEVKLIFSMNDILQFVNEKLPVTIDELVKKVS